MPSCFSLGCHIMFSLCFFFFPSHYPFLLPFPFIFGCKSETAWCAGLRPFLLACSSRFFFVEIFIPFIISHYSSSPPALPPSSNSDPGLHSGPSSPLPTTVRAFIFIARIFQHFLPSSTCIEEWFISSLCLLYSQLQFISVP